MMAQSFAETHPSEPNYLALFAGNTFGVTKDTLPGRRRRPAQPRLRIARRRLHIRRLRRRPARRPARRSAARASTRASTCRGPTSATCRRRTRCRSPRSRLGNYASLPTVSFVIPEQRQQHARRLDRAGRRLAEPPAVRVRQLGQGQQQPADRDLGRGRRRPPQPDPDGVLRRARAARHLQRDRSATTTCFPRWSRCTGCPRRVTRRMRPPSPPSGAGNRYRDRRRLAVAIVCRMAADLVPIRLSLSDGDRYTVWAPRWRDAGDEWEAFLGKDEDLYVFETVADLVAFVRSDSDNDLVDHPAWKAPDRGPRAQARPGRRQAVRSGRRRGAGGGEADRGVGDRAGRHAGDRVVHRIGVRAAGGVEVLQRQSHPGHGFRRDRATSPARPGQKRWNAIAEVIGRSWDDVLSAIDDDRQHARGRRGSCQRRPPTNWPRSRKEPGATRPPRTRPGRRGRRGRAAEDDRRGRRDDEADDDETEDDDDRRGRIDRRRGGPRRRRHRRAGRRRGLLGCRWASTRSGS